MKQLNLQSLFSFKQKHPDKKYYLLINGIAEELKDNYKEHLKSINLNRIKEINILDRETKVYFEFNSYKSGESLVENYYKENKYTGD